MKKTIPSKKVEDKTLETHQSNVSRITTFNGKGNVVDHLVTLSNSWEWEKKDDPAIHWITFKGTLYDVALKLHH
jgi:hypothetical protein